MTDEAAARARLLIYYEERLTLLGNKIVALEEEIRTATPERVPKIEKTVTRFTKEVANIRLKTHRLRNALADE